MRNILVTVFILFVFSLPMQGQGRVEVRADQKIDRIMESHSQLMAQNPGINGFRVQIFWDSGNNSKAAAIEEKTNFETKYPDIEAYLSFDEPNYKVRIGNFRTKLEAEGCLNKINKTYPNAIVVPDFIEFPKLSLDSGMESKEEQP